MGVDREGEEKGQRIKRGAEAERDRREWERQGLRQCANTDCDKRQQPIAIYANQGQTTVQTEGNECRSGNEEGWKTRTEGDKIGEDRRT